MGDSPIISLILDLALPLPELLLSVFMAIELNIIMLTYFSFQSSIVSNVPV